MLCRTYSDVWVTITKPMQKKIEAVEMWFWRRMLRIPWTAKKTNIEVMEEAGQKRSLINRIKKTTGRLHWPHNEKGRLGTPYHHGKT